MFILPKSVEKKWIKQKAPDVSGAVCVTLKTNND